MRLKQLVEDFFQYTYLPRLRDPHVLAEAVRDGLNLLTWEQDSFAYAEAYDDAVGKYRGLQAGRVVRVTIDNTSLLVKPDIAARLIQVEPATSSPGALGAPAGSPTAASLIVAPGEAAPVAPTRFHGTVDLDPSRVGRDAGKIAEEVVQHLAGLVGSRVEVSLEIHAERHDGFPDNVVRTVTENAKTLKFKGQGFEVQ